MDKDAILGWLIILPPLIWFGGLDESKIRYEFQYDEVRWTDKPHDCDFMTAPLGNKNCKYEQEVSTLLFSIGVSGNPIISYDGGEYWHEHKGGPTDGDGVYISWSKVND